MDYIDYNSREYKTSRTSYVLFSAFEWFITILITDAFLAKLLTHLGISDALAGIISSFVSLAFVFQLLSIFVLKRKINTKKFVITFEATSQLCFAFLYIIPFLNLPGNIKKLLVVLGIIFGYALKYIVSSIMFKWTNMFVDPMHRGSFSATKEIISLVGGIIFQMTMGAIVDKFVGLNKIEGGFLFLACSMLVLNVINFICLMKIKNCDINTEQSAKVPMKVMLQHTLFNKKFVPVIIATSLFSFGQYFTYGFLGVFKTNDLAMSLFLVSAVTMVANVMRILVSKPFGKYSDKKSYAKGMELGYILAAFSFLMIVFTTPDTWYMIILSSVLLSVATAGTNQNTFNIIYSYVDSNYISQAMAFRSSISGIIGFIAALLGGKMLDVIQSAGNTFMGLHVYGQQVMAVISVVCIMVSVAIIHFVVAKNKVTIQ